MMGRRFRTVVFSALVAFAPAAALAAPAESLEHAIKATFLYKFVPFVDWPAAAFESDSSPVVICAFGTDPVTLAIDANAAGQRVGDRPVIVRHLQNVTRDSGCHVLYIVNSNSELTREAIGIVRGSPILTVTDSPMSPAAAGIINFVVQDNRVRFDIDDVLAADNGLTISSKLLSLARRVRVRP